MSLIFTDSFDHYTTTEILKKWSARLSSSQIQVYTSAGRRGGGCLAVTDNYVTKYFAQPKNTFIVGAATLPIGIAFYGTTSFFSFVDSVNAVMLSFSVAPDGAIRVHRGTAQSTIIAFSGPNIVPLSGWSYIEIKAYIHDTLGTVEVRVNNITVILATNLDTKVGSTDQIAGMRISSSSGSSSVNPAQTYWDDLYVCDTLGSNNNNFLGDIRVDAIRPDGPGFHQDFTPSVGTDHAALVDETLINTDDYVGSAISGNKETFTLSDTAVVGPIRAIQVLNAVGKADAGACLVRNIARSGGVDYQGEEVSPGVTSSYVSTIFDLNPNGSVPWDSASVNALEVGLEITTA